jgi:hypothetical protein
MKAIHALMKYSLLLIASFMPLATFAGVSDLFSNTVVDSQTVLILNSYSLASAVLLGFITSALVFWNARKMKGGIFGKAFLFLSIGMFLVLAAFAVGSLPFVSGMINSNLKLAHDFLFMCGYILMAIGGNHIFKAIQGK